MPASPRAVLTSLVLYAIAGSAHAAEWKHEFAPYVWGSAMDGTLGIGSISADASLSFSDILDNLEMGFMGMYRASTDRYSITIDALYMGLGVTEKGPGGVLRADMDVDQVGLEADFGYALTDRFTVLAGLRYVELESELDVAGPLGGVLSAKTRENWVDPVVGAQYSWPFADEWTFTVRGDIGGFGVGSDLAWQGQAMLRWQFSQRTAAGLAYRYLDMDYEDGKADEYFKYDMATSGPALGIVFTF